MKSLTIAFVRAGEKFPAHYLNHLMDMLTRCLPTNTQFKFVCFTDQPETIENIENRPLPEGVHGWWAKLAMFRPEAFEPGERVLFFDLDTLFVGLLDDIVAYRGDFAILRDVYRPDGLQSSVMAWEAGKFDHIWHEWEKAGRPEVEGGDQIWIEKFVLDSADRLQDLFPGQFVSYKVHCLQGLPRNARVVFYHGTIKPWDAQSGWVYDFWKIGGLGPVDLELVCNTSLDDIEANVRSALERGLPEVPRLELYPHQGTLCIIGGGPSLKGCVEEIRVRQKAGQTIWALNGAAKFLEENGIVPDALWMMDARPDNAGFLDRLNDRTEYFIASQCSPVVFDALKGRKVTLWHTERCQDWIPDDATILPGGSTVGLNAIVGGLLFGYRYIHLYGFDSSYSDDVHHAYSQPLNDGEAVYDVHVFGRSFKAAGWMIQQALDFQALLPQLALADATVVAHGDGLLPHIAYSTPKMEIAHDQRARSVLRRLPTNRPVKGAEIGVFIGAMSRALLKRPDLSLVMVDAWEEGDGLYEDEGGLSDYHARLSQKDQDTVYKRALWNTHFAKERRTVIRNRSLEAAREVPDGSLDFVFIDANHSYGACKDDINAWLPKLKPGGLLCGHDYDHPEFPEWGVKRAVDEYASMNGFEVQTDENFTWFIQLPKQAVAA